MGRSEGHNFPTLAMKYAKNLWWKWKSICRHCAETVRGKAQQSAGQSDRAGRNAGIRGPDDPPVLKKSWQDGCGGAQGIGGGRRGKGKGQREGLGSAGGGGHTAGLPAPLGITVSGAAVAAGCPRASLGGLGKSRPET